MDIKLKSNKESEEFNSSEKNENINDVKKRMNKRNGIIATLIALLIIASVALGMCASYESINKYSKGMRKNYFNEWTIAETLVELGYSLNYRSIIENDGQEPSDVLLDIQRNTVNYSEDEYNYTEEYLNDNINSFNNNVYQWGNISDGNLKYYYYNTLNKRTDTNLNEDITVENDSINLSKFNKDLYQFYAVVNFNSNGNVKIEEVFGADSNILKYNIENEIIDIKNNYASTFQDEVGSYDMRVNSIKDMTIVYAVPKVLQAYDTISWGIENADMAGYTVLGAGVAFSIAGILLIIALIFPIRKAKEMALFRGISKIPFEIWIVIIGLAIAAFGPLAGQLIKATLNRDLQLVFTEMIPNLIIPERVIWIFNFIIWLLSYAAVFFFVLVIKYVFNLGIIEYIKRRTIFGMVIMFFVRIIKRTLDEVTKVDLREKNTKLIIRLLVINAIILLIITSIWFFGIPVVILYSIVLFFVIRKYVDKISEKYSKLREATSKVAQGKLDVKIEEDLGLFEPFKEDLQQIQKGFKKAVDEEVKSQKMKTDLISNVSHDLKTPLTAIITYADLLKDENLPEEKRKQYIEILDRKAQRLQVLIEDLFEMSKASSGNITLNIENIDVVSLMKQTLLELEDKLEEANLTVRRNLPEGKVILPLDSQRTFRVFENLVINMTKYAMPNTRVFIDMIENNDNVEIVMKNMAAEEITFNVETIAERFVRGDESRNTEGSGLGLAIAKSFVELQGGKFNINVDGDLFKVTIIFNK